MKIRVYVSTNLVGSKTERVIDLQDDEEFPMSDNDIEESARDVMYDMISWGWERVDG